MASQVLGGRDQDDRLPLAQSAPGVEGDPFHEDGVVLVEMDEMLPGQGLGETVVPGGFDAHGVPSPPARRAVPHVSIRRPDAGGPPLSIPDHGLPRVDTPSGAAARIAPFSREARAWREAVSASVSSAAASSPVSTSGPGSPSATRTCAASGARTPRARKRRRPWRARCAWARRARSPPSRRWWPRPRSTASGSAARTTRASRTWSASWTRLGKGAKLVGIACEKPLGAQRGGSEAHGGAGREDGASCTATSRTSSSRPASSAGREIVWARGAALSGRPYLARAAEEHSGPHMPWFWQGDLQGGGVLNDMMCHSVEVGRHLLTAPGARRATRCARSRSRRRSPPSSGRGPNTRTCSSR